jgi:hypothetical protein
MKKAIVPGYAVALLLIGFSGCEKNSGEAVVLAKEHIDAALPTAETPNAQSVPGPNEQLRPMAEIARERPGQSQVSHRQVHGKRLGC